MGVMQRTPIILCLSELLRACLKTLGATQRTSFSNPRKFHTFHTFHTKWVFSIEAEKRLELLISLASSQFRHHSHLSVGMKFRDVGMKLVSLPKKTSYLKLMLIS